MSHHFLRRARPLSWLGCAIFGAVALWVPPAHGQASNAAIAQGLYDEAKALMAAGHVAEACPKLEESQRIDPGSGTLINLALCYEKTGRLASAWATYLDAAAAAEKDQRAERMKAAKDRAAALLPRLTRIRIDVPHEARLSGLQVQRDGVEIGAAQWGVAVPSDPGSHEIIITASGYREFRTTVTIASDTSGKTEVVTVPKLEPLPALATRTPQDASTSSSDPLEPVSRDTASVLGNQVQPNDSGSGLGTQRILGIGATGVGVVGLVVSGVFGLRAMNQWDQAKNACAASYCDDDGSTRAGNKAYQAGNISTVAGVIGIAGVAAGVVLWVTAPKRENRASAQLELGFSQLRLKGRF